MPAHAISGERVGDTIGAFADAAVTIAAFVDDSEISVGVAVITLAVADRVGAVAGLGAAVTADATRMPGSAATAVFVIAAVVAANSGVIVSQYQRLFRAGIRLSSSRHGTGNQN